MPQFTIKLVPEVQEWESFIIRQPFTPFVQSVHYVEFHRAMKEHGWIVGVYEGETLVAGTVIVSVHARRGNFLYLPYGPVIADSQRENEAQILAALFQWIETFARLPGGGAAPRAEGGPYLFIRVSPFSDDTPERREWYRLNGLRRAPIHVLAETTWLLDITPSEEILLSNMNKNHRNLIRRCHREQVMISTSTDPEQLAGLNSLLDITAERHRFVRFSREYIYKEFSAFAKQDQAVLFEARLPDGRLDSAAIIMFFGTMACYRHSASLGLNKQLPTSYALQWAVIQEAKKRGLTYYNFWGIAPDRARATHPFYGITHFKKGFGGFKKELLPCHDLSVGKMYWVNWLVETVRRHKRGF